MEDQNIINQDEQGNQDELELIKARAEDYLNGWKRAKADYLNLKKETEKRQQEIVQFANLALISELLPIYDHFKLAINHIPAEEQDKDWVKGFSHIKKQWQDFFRQIGIEEIDTVSKSFDPEYHEAVVHEAKEGFDSDVVFEEVKPGYIWHGKVIQPAKVKVAK